MGSRRWALAVRAQVREVSWGDRRFRQALRWRRLGAVDGAPRPRTGCQARRGSAFSRTACGGALRWGRAEHTRGGRAAAGGRDGWRRRPGPDPERLPSTASILSPQRGCFPRSRTKTAPSEGPGAAGCGVPSARSGASIAASQQQLLIKFHRGPRCTADLHALPSGLIHRTSVQFCRLDKVFILIFGLSVPQKFSFV